MRKGIEWRLYGKIRPMMPEIMKVAAMKRFLPLLLLVLLSACSPQGKTGTVKLASPPPDTIVYSSAVTVAGVAEGVNAGGFIITLTDATGAVLARRTAPEHDLPFSYELIHGYSGEPTSATLTITAADAPDDPPYASVQIMLAALAHRPEGTYAYIISPEAGDEIGGDKIEVHGRISGVSAPSFAVELLNSNGTIIDSVIVTLPASYIADDLPWRAELNPKEETGSAILQIIGPDGAPIHSVPVVLSTAAG